ISCGHLSDLLIRREFYTSEKLSVSSDRTAGTALEQPLRQWSLSDEMLNSWRKSVPLTTRTNANAFAIVTVVLAFLALLTGMTVPQPYHHGIFPDLPKVYRPVSLPHALREDAMIIGVNRQGDLFFGRDRLRPEQLPELIRQDVALGSEKKIYIRADARTRYRI